MANKIEFIVKNTKPFVAWLKRFTIDNSLLLEIDEPTSAFIAKTYNEERSIVKYSSIRFEDAGLTTKASKKPIRIKAGIYHVPRLIKILDLFGSEEYKITFNYDEVKGDVIDYACTSIVIKNNKDLNFLIEGSPLSIFKYISDDLFHNKIAVVDKIAEFNLTPKNIDKINSLCDLNDDKFVKFSKQKTSILVSDKYFNHKICEDAIEHAENNGEIDFFKTQFEQIDSQDYKVLFGEDRIVFGCTNYDLVTVLSRVVKTDEENKQIDDMKFE